MLKCNKCDFNSSDPRELACHKSLHYFEKNHLFSCEKCQNIDLRTIREIKKHLQVFHSCSAFNDYNSSTSVDSSSEIKKNDNSNLKCKKCNFKGNFMDSAKHLLNHLKRNETVECFLCELEIKSASNLYKHTRQNHPIEADNRLNNNSFRSSQENVNLFNNHHEVMETSNSSGSEIKAPNAPTSKMLDKSEQFFNHLYSLCLTLKAKAVPENEINTVVEEISRIMDFMLLVFQDAIGSLSLKDELMTKLHKELSKISSFITQCDKLKSAKRRFSFFKADRNYVSPVEIKLGRNDSNEELSNKKKLKELRTQTFRDDNIKALNFLAGYFDEDISLIINFYEVSSTLDF